MAVSVDESGAAGAPRSNGAALLAVEDIHTFYGAIEALKGISLEVRARAAEDGRHPLRRAGDPDPRRPRGRGDRHRALARGAADLPADDGPREPADGPLPAPRPGRHPRGH